MPQTVLLIGAFDTKGEEYAFLREQLLAAGCDLLTVNCGVLGTTDRFPVEIEATAIAQAAGTTLDDLRAADDRGQAIKTMADGAARLARELFDAGRFDAMIGMGGSGGSSVITAAMRALPLGIPKICVCTVAVGDTTQYIGTKDIVLIPSIVDVSGLNRISRQVISRAAGALVGMLQREPPSSDTDRPIIVASMFGNTTECVDACRKTLDEQGYEVLVFHAVGTGGQMMESLIDEGLVDACLDITTTEWADELCHGVFAAGPNRLNAPGRAGIPHLIAPGCIDMVNFGPMDTVPAEYRDADRLFYEWNPAVTLMRTNADENRELGRIFAEKANTATGPIAIVLPLKGVSILDGDGQLFCDRAADQAFFDTLREHLNPEIPVHEVDANINDPEFSNRCVEILLDLIGGK